MLGTHLEKSGWRQGSIIRASDVQQLLKGIGIDYEPSIVLILASQSCDIAHNDTDADPNIELFIARTLPEGSDGNFTHNKNPRVLHTQILFRTKDENVFGNEDIELKAFEKICLHKNNFESLQPDPDRKLDESQLNSYISWIVTRYSRPALPSTFNDRIKKADPNCKNKKIAKKGNHQLCGIYVNIYPDAEISEDESYKVNLLGLLPSNTDGNADKAHTAIAAYAEILESAGMEVSTAIKTENEISVATLKSFKRFYLDDLSFREEAPLPPETQLC